MKSIIQKTLLKIIPIIILLLQISCKTSEENKHIQHDKEDEENKRIHLSKQQFESLNLKADTLSYHNINNYIEVNGTLEVPPKNQATVTAIIGANITDIMVIEGDKIKKNQVLAYLSHPNLIKLQSDYIKSYNQLQYLEKEYSRQKVLYEKKIGAGKNLQKIYAEYQSMKGLEAGYKIQLKLMRMNLKKILKGNLYEQIPVISPIDGYIRFVEIKLGQYVQPQTEMFEIINIKHIHADLMVFEKDISKVKKGQKVKFYVESLPKQELKAFIYSVGKSFESSPKAIHIHAEIENKKGLLIPGMYVRGKIISESISTYALPKEGVVREGDKHFIFSVKKENDKKKYDFVIEPIEVKIGLEDDHWVQIEIIEPISKESKFASNNAYYLLSEMKKGDENSHSH